MEFLEYYATLSLVSIISKGLMLMFRRIVLGIKVDWLHYWMQILTLCCDAIIGPLYLDKSPLPAHDAHCLVHDHVFLCQRLQLFLSLNEIFASILINGIIIVPLSAKWEVGLSLNLHLCVEVAI